MSWYERRVLNPMLERVLGTPRMEVERAELVSRATGRVLEVGPGPGLNFPHYPAEVARLTTISPEEELPPRARERAKARGATLRHFKSPQLPWPFAAELFDTVVCTLVLCSVPSPVEVLKEVRRVLAPDGQLLLFEHVRSSHAGTALLQQLATPLLCTFGGGCHPNRSQLEALELAGFDVSELETRQSAALPAPFSTVLVGVARPRA
jgi:SAM-dependent methyltransferase